MNYLSIAENCFADAPGGAARVAWDILSAMKRRGHRVAMFCTRPAGRRVPLGVEVRDGVEIVRYEKPVLPPWHPNRMRANIDAANAAAHKWLGDQSWDTVHVHAPVLGQGVMAALGSGPRYVTTVHSPIVMEQEVNWAVQGWTGRLKLLLGRGLLRRLEAEVLRNSQAIHALSAFTQSKLEFYHGIGDRVNVIPHWCIDKAKRRIRKLEARRRLGWPEWDKIFFSVRQLRMRYGLDVAINAFGNLPQRYGYKYFIAGEGPLRPALEKQIAERELNERVHLMGRVSDKDLELAYQAADIFVLPTVALECFGLIILESLSWGCPLIATDAGAIPEVLGRIFPGGTIPAGDVDALREKLLAVLEDRTEVPPAEALMSRVQEVYGEAQIWPRMEALLTGIGH